MDSAAERNCYVLLSTFGILLKEHRILQEMGMLLQGFKISSNKRFQEQEARVSFRFSVGAITAKNLESSNNLYRNMVSCLTGITRGLEKIHCIFRLISKIFLERSFFTTQPCAYLLRSNFYWIHGNWLSVSFLIHRTESWVSKSTHTYLACSAPGLLFQLWQWWSSTMPPCSPNIVRGSCCMLLQKALHSNFPGIAAAGSASTEVLQCLGAMNSSHGVEQ